MVAFCIIVGDTIPHVLVALFPSLPETPFLWLLADRRAIIVLLILGISFPLSLYRDIAKVSSSPHVNRAVVADIPQLAKASTFALISMVLILITIVTQGPLAPAESKGPLKGSIIINDGVFQAIGVISFGLFPFAHRIG